MADLSWGKPRIFIQKLGEESPKWKEIPTPVENSTQLNPTKGDKKEAKLEGGENEAVKYGYNNYELVYQIRRALGKTMPIEHTDGVVQGDYKVALQPENPEVDGFIIDRSTVSVSDPFTTEEGSVWEYTHDVLKPDDGSKKVKWGKISVTGQGDTLTVEGSGGDFAAG